MSNKLFQNLVCQMRDHVGHDLGVIDESGVIVACSELAKIGEIRGVAGSEIFSMTKPLIYEGSVYRSFGLTDQTEYAVFIDGSDDMCVSYSDIIAVSLAGLKQFYDEKYDRANFIKSVILDNILPGDVYLKARDLHFDNDVERCVLLIRSSAVGNSDIFDAVQSLFPEKAKDFVININDSDIALVKEISDKADINALEQLAASIADSIDAKYHTHTLIGIGTVVTGIRELASSFKEAQVALEVGKVFDTEKTIVSYDNLGIARLIYQLPSSLCDMFLHEVFKRGSIDNLDHETLFTIQKFFDNNLNVSETSRKLFVHRNTLVYRLEKIRKLTGLDLREFDDAIVFKVALMVKKYLDSSPVKY